MMQASFLLGVIMLGHLGATFAAKEGLNFGPCLTFKGTYRVDYVTDHYFIVDSGDEATILSTCLSSCLGEYADSCVAYRAYKDNAVKQKGGCDIYLSGGNKGFDIQIPLTYSTMDIYSFGFSKVHCTETSRLRALKETRGHGPS